MFSAHRRRFRSFAGSRLRWGVRRLLCSLRYLVVLCFLSLLLCSCPNGSSSLFCIESSTLIRVFPVLSSSWGYAFSRSVLFVAALLLLLVFLFRHIPCSFPLVYLFLCVGEEDGVLRTGWYVSFSLSWGRFSFHSPFFFLSLLCEECGFYICVKDSQLVLLCCLDGAGVVFSIFPCVFFLLLPRVRVGSPFWHGVMSAIYVSLTGSGVRVVSCITWNDKDCRVSIFGQG